MVRSLTVTARQAFVFFVLGCKFPIAEGGLRPNPAQAARLHFRMDRLELFHRIQGKG